MGDGLAIILAKGKKPPMGEVAKMRGGMKEEADDSEEESTDMDAMKEEMADHFMKAVALCMKMKSMKGAEDYGSE